MFTVTTGRINEAKALKAAGWTVIDVTVKSARNAKSLAPTWAMVMGYKKGTLSEQEYTSEYMKILTQAQQRESDKWVRTISNHKKIAFLCYCRVNEFCHRNLLAQEFVSFARRQMNIEATLIPETKDRFNSSPVLKILPLP